MVQQGAAAGRLFTLPPSSVAGSSGSGPPNARRVTCAVAQAGSASCGPRLSRSKSPRVGIASVSVLFPARVPSRGFKNQRTPGSGVVCFPWGVCGCPGRPSAWGSQWCAVGCNRDLSGDNAGSRICVYPSHFWLRSSQVSCLGSSKVASEWSVDIERAYF